MIPASGAAAHAAGDPLPGPEALVMVAGIRTAAVGMRRDEGLIPGEHFAPLGDDPVADLRHWLARPEERARIARAGQELVLRRFTYENQVAELCRVIEETLP